MARWQESAACEGQTDLMFSDSKFGVARAKQLCAGCPVLDECREHVLALPFHVDGIWGELTRKQRQKIRRVRREAAAA